MNKISSNIKFLNKIKKIFFPFYKSKDLDFVFQVLEKDKKKNEEVAMFVGGSVRKHIRTEQVDDIDIATVFSPDEIKNKFKNTEIRVLETGIDHGSVTLLINNTKIEITTLRKDIKTDGRHAEVSYTDNWKDDSSRRDFSIKAIYMNRKGKIFDPQSGVKDLENNIVKFIGDPGKRIEEDYLRIIRFIRFAIQYNSEIEKSTLDAIKLNLNGVNNISKERILNELLKILKLKNFNNIIQKEDLKNIFSLVFPEFKYLNRIEKIKELPSSFYINKNIILATLLLDESNNHEYFCHKYKTSNNLKKKLEIIQSILKDYNLDKNYFTINLKKNVYLYGKEKLNDLNILTFLVNKKREYSNFLKTLQNIRNTKIPLFPYNGDYLIKKGLAQGKLVGKILKKLEGEWINNNYSLPENKVIEIIKKY